MRSFLFFVALLLCPVFPVQGAELLSVYELRCENRINPVGIDKTTPRFSWKYSSSQNGAEQSAYQLMVATDSALLAKGKPDLWDSGKCKSSASLWVPYEGLQLGSGMPLYWKVRIWDGRGKVSAWSPVAQCSVGLLSETDWGSASYIGFPTEAGYREAPQVKQLFRVEKPGGRLFLYVNSLGYHEAYINGRKVGEGVLAPAVSQFTKRSYVVAYDITPLVKPGDNQLMLWLGSGWYTESFPGVVHNGPLVRAQIEQVSGFRRTLVVATDGSWRGRKSGYTRQGNWRYEALGGETLDGRMAQTDLLPEGAQGREWLPVTVVSVPRHEASMQRTEQNLITETLSPVKITAVGKDTFLVDMGKCLTGWADIRFPRLQKSQQVVLEFGDILGKNGRLDHHKQIDRYVAAGSGSERFVNKFNYHGFRYIRIINLKEAPSADSIKAFLIRTGFETASSFACSDPDLNRIHDMVSYTLQCLSMGGVMVDCPTIERLGYGGDGNASTETAQTLFNLNPMYHDWLQAWADCLRDDGGMPHTAPNPYPAGGGPYWCGFIITASWRTYLHYGDSEILEKFYPAMQKWLGYAAAYWGDGLLKGWPETDYRTWYLGDWATPRGVNQMDPASVGLVNNCFMAVCFDNMQKIAGVLGKTDDAARYAQQKSDIQKQIHLRFFDAPKGSYGTGSQIDFAYPLLSGVVPAELRNEVTSRFKEATETTWRGHLTTGLVGVPVLTEWAVKNSAADFMYNMLKKRDYPGYLYMIDNGATTTWEHWDGARSWIHNCYNGIGSWFYQAPGGIQPVEEGPAFRQIRIEPQIPKGVTWAKTRKETPYGTLVVNWTLENGEIELSLQIPFGSCAEVMLPAGVNQYTLNGKSRRVGSNRGTENVEENLQGVALKGGKYTLRVSASEREAQH